jgi:hypothetical protein
LLAYGRQLAEGKKQKLYQRGVDVVDVPDVTNLSSKYLFHAAASRFTGPGEKWVVWDPM